MKFSLAIVGVVGIALLSANASKDVGFDGDRAHAFPDNCDAMVQAKSARETMFEEPLVDIMQVKKTDSDGTANASLELYTRFDDQFAFNHCEHKTHVDATAPVRNRKPVMFVHFHKAAGTSVCCHARRREKVISPSSNCNALDGVLKPGTLDGWNLWRPHRYEPPASWTSCEHRHARMKEQSLTWQGIERDILDGDLCPEYFVYFTIVRHPMGIIGSVVHYQPDKRGIDSFPLASIVECITNQYPTCKHHSKGFKDPLLFGYYWKIFDNFMVRTLGGHDTMMAPPGHINSSHFERAKNVLQSFDLVLILERLSEQKSLDAMDHFIGWHLEPRSRANRAKSSDVEPTMSSGLFASLQTINRWDIALYNLAVEWHNKLQL